VRHGRAIARATTDRSVVAVCGYSGWQDWYLAANLGDTDALPAISAGTRSFGRAA
jgi:hypothetical protein